VREDHGDVPDAAGRILELVRYWLPVVLWAAVILAASSDLFSSRNTGSLLESLVVAIFGYRPEGFPLMHAALRKLGHLAEYAVLGGLAFRAARGDGHGFAMRWAVTAVAVALVVAGIDEWHQTFVPSRTGSPSDVVLDTVGASLAQMIVRIRTSR
jgi:VanZ family protein